MTALDARARMLMLQMWDRGQRTIIRRIKGLSSAERQAFRKTANSILWDPRARSDVHLRSGAARAIIALLPASTKLLAALLDDRTSLWYEVHFTLFVALDERKLRRIDRERVLALIRRYLNATTSEAGYAAWKAGETLGEHWPGRDSLQVLMDVAKTAQHPAGRKAALHGLAHGMRYVDNAMKRNLCEIIDRAIVKDRSRRVRNYASWVKAALTSCEGIVHITRSGRVESRRGAK